MRADLHLHSSYSDGAYPPREIARRVAAAGVGLFSLTDHDGMEGEEEARAAAKEFGLAFVSGWEISSYAEEGKVHVLGYGCRRGKAYEIFLEERIRGGYLRAEDSLKKANARFSLSLTMEDVLREQTEKSAPVHTVHVVRAVARAIGIPSEKVYSAYFAKGKAAYSALYRPTPEEAVSVIHACGGIAVLAHPGRLGADCAAREALADRLCAVGLDGIECFYTSHTVRETERFRAYAKARGLLETGGSDFHADGRGEAVGQPEFRPSERLLRALRIR